MRVWDSLCTLSMYVFHDDGMGDSIRMDVNIGGNILYVHAWEAWTGRERAPAWTLVVFHVYGQCDLGGFFYPDGTSM